MASALSSTGFVLRLRTSESTRAAGCSSSYCLGHSLRKRPRTVRTIIRAVSVELVQQDGSTTTLEVDEDDNILSVGLDAGLDIPHDCRTGVCMRCSARLLAGEVDQSAGMLNEDVKQKGYVLLCCAVPQGEGVKVQVIEEDELLTEVFDG